MQYIEPFTNINYNHRGEAGIKQSEYKRPNKISIGTYSTKLYVTYLQ